MSQAPRQDSDGQPLPPGPGLPLSLPTVREAQVPLSSSLIPRDYLGQRSDEHTARSPKITTTGARKPTSSLFHTSFQPYSPERTIHESPLSHRSLYSDITNPPLGRESQTERINRLSKPSGSEGKSASSAIESIDQNLKDVKPEHGVGMSEGRINGEFRKMSGTLGSAQISTSPPSSPAPSLPPAVVERTGHRIIPRTSSIDSAISSISSTSHSHKSSLDSNSLTSADINNLIAAAGSAEAVIVHLLKDKNHAAAQNDQLWRLLEKQRALVLGLNKDLDRALKDKERYRKRLKEIQSQVPPLPTKVPSHPAEELASANNRAPDDSRSDTVRVDQVHISDQNSRALPQERSTRALNTPINEGQARDTTLVPSPLHVLHTSSQSSGESSGQLPVQSDIGDASPVSPRLSGVPSVPSRETEATSSSADNLSTRQQPTLSKLSDKAGDIHETCAGMQPLQNQQEKMPPPSRKPPPAPLNLGQARHRSSPIDPASLHGSDTDYDDILELDEISTMERGRRRTREDDDKEREAAVIREQVACSKSKKKSKPAAVIEGSQGNSHQTVSAGLPSSPRKLIAPVPAHLTVGQFSTTESLVAIMSSGPSESTSLGERIGMSPPLSPGLPVSPRPGDRPLGSPLPRLPREGSGVVASPPVSPRTAVPSLPLSPRAAKPLIPLSPKSIQAESTTPTMPSIDVSVEIDSPKSPYGFDRRIYQGLVSDEYPGLLLPPNALPSIEVKVSSSRLRPSRNSYIGGKATDEEPVFTLSISSRSNRAELWRVEKIIMALPQLDHQIRQLSDFSGKLPDRTIFSGHSPAKVDARRDALNVYFETLLDTPMTEPAALVICRFLSSDAIEPRDDETNLLKANGKVTPELLRGPDGKARKEGYLTKRGKNFGGWKARYFVLHGPELKYYESPGGPHLGTIKIHNAQIGKQSQSGPNQSPPRNEDDSDNQYRHAFLILEPKKKDSSALVRHVLCAESDDERDAWVDALLQYVESQSSEDEKVNAASSRSQNHPKHPTQSNTKSRLFPSNNKKNTKGTDSPDMDSPDMVQGFSYDDAVAAEPPVHGPLYEREGTKSPPAHYAALGESLNPFPGSQPNAELSSASYSSKMISGPTNGAIIQNVGAWGNKPSTTTKEKKRSIWGFRARSSSDLASQTQSHNDSLANSHNNPSTERRELVRPVFGLPLAEAVQFCPSRGVDVDLPAVVYRCIEYLQAKGAASEEGIFRLSGSNVVVKALKERFNTEGDVDFLAGDHYYDVHAVASLFKQYLRELPTTVLTRELHLDFLRVLELDDKEKKIAAFNSLVHRLPRSNLTLLRALSQFLIAIVNNSDVNKMTVRNVGIVFAPTLNIPAPVFSMFLTDFDSIFGSMPDPGKTVELSVDPSLMPQDVRSPRHQMFSEIPTPAYNETSFYAPEDSVTQSPHELRANYDTGFIPMFPSYDHPHSGSEIQHHQTDHTQIPSLNRMLVPGTDSSCSTKAKRRESSLFFMDLGHRKSSIQHLQNDQVTEESAFE